MARSANVSDLGNNLSQLCFAYPEHLVGRKHGPRGYAHYETYRDWLRDEFAFRCAYCLMREGWLRGRSGLQIDHCIPHFGRSGTLINQERPRPPPRPDLRPDGIAGGDLC